MIKHNGEMLLFIVFTVLLSGCAFSLVGSKLSGLQINVEGGKAVVYLNGQHVGETNFLDNKLKASEYVVKLESITEPSKIWETKVKLIPGLTTVLNKTFGATTQESSNYLMQLEPISDRKISELTVITTPENVIARIDDQPKGFTPLVNVGLPYGNHKVTLSAPGYKTIEMNTVLNEGHRLLVTATLGKNLSLAPRLELKTATESGIISDNIATYSATPKPKITSKPSPTITPIPKSIEKTIGEDEVLKPYVEILSTTTGWLRVRSEPNGLVNNEIAKVNTGDKVTFVEKNDLGWYKIEYEKEKYGWVAAMYCRLVE